MGMIANPSFAKEIQFLDIKFDKAILKKVDFDNQFYFEDKKTLKYTNLRIDNKAATLEWSPNSKRLMLSNIWFGKKPKGREIRGDFEYRFIIINLEKGIINPFKIPVHGWNHSTNLSWFSDKEIADFLNEKDLDLINHGGEKDFELYGGQYIGS